MSSWGTNKWGFTADLSHGAQRVYVLLCRVASALTYCFFWQVMQVHHHALLVMM